MWPSLRVSLLAVAVFGCAESHTGSTDAETTIDGMVIEFDGSVALDGSRPDECIAASDCTLLPESCCGRCGVPAPDDMIAVPNDLVDENRAVACEGPIACPGCAAMPDPLLLAVCEANRCVALDLHTADITRCRSDGECQLAPRTCCACGPLGSGEVIAFNSARGSYSALVCDPRADCPPCVATFEGLAARCELGHCVVRMP